jgi:hypothetical protein
MTRPWAKWICIQFLWSTFIKFTIMLFCRLSLVCQVDICKIQINILHEFSLWDLFDTGVSIQFYPCGVHPVAICIRIPLKYTCDRNWEFTGVTFILSVHNMFRPPRAILRWNTTTSLTYFEKAIDTTPDPLFCNCSLIWCKSLIIYFTIHVMVNEFLF